MPRKTRVWDRRGRPVRGASMRPRPDAAENGSRGEGSRQRAHASMRPRPDAAENSLGFAGAIEEAAASMRPRPDAAENLGVAVIRTGVERGFNEAAARCRGKRGKFRPPRPCGRRFNEAAARCRGKRARGNGAPNRVEPASMRPRPDAAENPGMQGDALAASAASMRPRPDAAENA